MNKIIRYLSQKFISFLGLAPLKGLETVSKVYFETQRNVKIENYLRHYLNSNPKYQDKLRLNKYEYNIYSQNGEDGMIEEIFHRIGHTNQYFVEFGVHGIRNNSTFLLPMDGKACG